MTLPRTTFVLATLWALASGYVATAKAQQSGQESGFATLGAYVGALGSMPAQRYFGVTIRDAVTRAPIRIQEWTETYGFAVYPKFAVDSNFLLCSGGLGSTLAPDALLGHLRRMVIGKNAGQIRDLIQQIEDEPQPVGRLTRLFNLPALSSSTLQGSYSLQGPGAVGPAPTTLRGAVTDAQLEMLRTGQEVSVDVGVQCVTVNQADQIVGEGLRVLRIVAQQLAPGGPATSTTPATGAGPSVTPGTGTTLQRP